MSKAAADVFKGVDPDALTDEQRRVQDAIVRGPRGRSGELMNLWLHSPELADRAQKLGSYLRFGCGLPAALREMVILTVARYWECEFEWAVHEKLARDAGASQANLDSIAGGVAPVVSTDMEERTLAFCREVLQKRRPAAETVARLREVLTDKDIVELCALIGHYIHGAIVLNAAAVPAPESVTVSWSTRQAVSRKG